MQQMWNNLWETTMTTRTEYPNQKEDFLLEVDVIQFIEFYSLMNCEVLHHFLFVKELISYICSYGTHQISANC